MGHRPADHVVDQLASDGYLTLPAAATRARVSVRTIESAIARGAITARLVNGCRFVAIADARALRKGARSAWDARA